ncbi:MAG: inositol monophosphatase family protein [Massilibacteroides sp.]|nr:inositol monophosphatase family protein [Massilibacteroides sp.]MDD3063444.1 inositol monophosphatase family protein [Massilibacteroides sp.]MDD4114466.1 inositol monophosphatase family protein [Massilibacteroides sp.]MDD4660959.1 inositol monophosphatase family protein [Massilibacteroides sp.]
MNNLKEITLAVCETAKQVGVFLREERKTFSLDSVEQKHDHDYVSYVDKTAEKKLVEALKRVYPKAGFITEEGTVDRSNTELNWIIDPLDGTTNYIQDNAPYCISIALRSGNDLLIGMVYEVCRDECYFAWKEGGAYLNGKPIHVSEKQISNALIGIDLPYNAESYKPVVLSIIDKLYGKVSSLRVNGSAAMGLCYVAAGRYDGWMEAYINPWDYSAGVLIVREAGGTVTDFNGKDVHSHHVIATNGILHSDLKAVLPPAAF